MGRGGCFRSILHLKKTKGGKVNGSSGWRNGGEKHLLRTSAEKRIEDVAATRIQTAVRAFLARKTLRRLKCAEKFQGLSGGPFVREQVASTLCYLHKWSRIQSEITARRIRMVTEARLKQKKLENQLKLDAKLHKLEVEWCGGPGTLDEILAKLYQREEAASKLESRLRPLPWPDFLLSSQRLGLELHGALVGCTAMGNSSTTGSKRTADETTKQTSKVI